MKYLFFITVIILGVTTFPIKAQETTFPFKENAEYIDSIAQIIGNIELALKKIDDSNYFITGEGVAGNVGVYIAVDGVYLIDNQWSALADKIKEMVGSVTSKPIKLIINTHFHFDHTQGNMAFGKEGTPIIAHTNARTRMMQRQVIHGHVSQVQNPYPPEGLPTLTFTNKIEFFDGDETIELKFLGNAHTDGDIVVHLKNANMYYLGDLFVTYGLPVIDPDAGGDIYAFIETLDYLISNSDDQTKFVPGHGPVSYKKDMVIFRDLLYSVKEYIKDSYKQGKDLNHTITDAKKTVVKDVGGVNADRFISLVYEMVIKHEN